jgi:hypothetical protein
MIGRAMPAPVCTAYRAEMRAARAGTRWSRYAPDSDDDE